MIFNCKCSYYTQAWNAPSRIIVYLQKMFFFQIPDAARHRISLKCVCRGSKHACNPAQQGHEKDQFNTHKTQATHQRGSTLHAPSSTRCQLHYTQHQTKSCSTCRCDRPRSQCSLFLRYKPLRMSKQSTFQPWNGAPSPHLGCIGPANRRPRGTRISVQLCSHQGCFSAASTKNGAY